MGVREAEGRGSKVQRSKIEKKEEKRKLKHRRISTTIDFYIIIQLFFVLRLVSFYFYVLNSFYGPLGVLFIV